MRKSVRSLFFLLVLLALASGCGGSREVELERPGTDKQIEMGERIKNKMNEILVKRGGEERPRTMPPAQQAQE